MIARIATDNGFLALTRHILVLLALTLISFPAAPGFSQNLPPQASSRAEAEGLTQALVALNARYQHAQPAERPQMLNRMLDVASNRHKLLGSLIEENPGEVLRVALPAYVRARMPTQVRAYLEEKVELKGEIEVLYEDYPDGRARLRHFLNAYDKCIALHFKADPPGLLSGTPVRASGVLLDDAMALESSEDILTLAAGGAAADGGSNGGTPAPIPNTFSEQKTLVILVNFQDNPIEPYTVAYAQSVVFGTTSDFFLENSYQQTWLSGDVVGWYTIALDSTGCEQLKIRDYAKSAATAAGVDLSAYTRYVVAFPQNACAFWGTATVGGNPSQTWINGRLELAVVGHELGHNLGLEHSHSLVCNDGTSIGQNCTELEYGDGLDIMGWSDSAHFNAFQKERLGWLNTGISPPITTVQTDGIYVLDPYGLTGSNPQALKILKGISITGYSDWYYVEFRQAIGFDSIIASSTAMDSNNILNGVVIHMGSENNGGNTNGLLDMTPETYQLYTRDPALTVGNSFSDPEAGVTITPVSAGSTGAVVSVTFSSPACMHANPTVTLSPSQGQGVVPGTAVTYTVSLTNNDNAGCTASSFSLQATVPSGWTAVFASPTLTLNPGAGASTTLTVTSPASATSGFYTVEVTATNSAYASYTVANSVSYEVVSSALALTVSPDKASYSHNQWVTLTAKVSAGGTPVANASVTFLITEPDGSVIAQSTTSDGNGSAVVTFRLKRKDPIGVYQVRADANFNALSGSAATSFTVQ